MKRILLLTTLFLAASPAWSLPTDTPTPVDTPSPTFTPTIVSNNSLLKTANPGVLPGPGSGLVTYSFAWSFNGPPASASVQEIWDTLPGTFTYISFTVVSGPAPVMVTATGSLLDMQWAGPPAVSAGDAGQIDVYGMMAWGGLGQGVSNTAIIYNDTSPLTYGGPAWVYWATATPANTVTPTETTTWTSTPAPGTPTSTPTLSPTVTATPTATPTLPLSPTPSPSVTPVWTSTGTPTLSPTLTFTPTQTLPYSPTASPTQSPQTSAAPATPIPDPGGGAYVYPDPVLGADAQLAFNLDGPGTAKVRVFTAAGTAAAVVSDSFSSGGTATLTLPTAGFAPGIYLYRLDLSYDDGRRTRLPTGKFIVGKR